MVERVPARHRLGRAARPRRCEAADARVRAVLARSTSARPAWSTTAGSSPAATSRTRPTGSRCAPSAALVGALRADRRRPAGRAWPAVAGDGAAADAVRALPPAALEYGGPDLLVDTARRRPLPLRRVLPGAFGPGRPASPSRADGLTRRRRRHPHQARRRRADRRADPLVHRRLHRRRVADEQAAALLMAILFRGMTGGELATWTAAMIDSGERLDLSARRAGPPSTSTRPAASATRSRCVLVPAGRGLRRRRAAALGPGPRPHRRHARQDGGDPRLAGRRSTPTR